jgi:hypothetical protein
MRSGRPLRFIAVMVGGWTGGRAMILWQTTGQLPGIVPLLLPTAHAVVPPAVTPLTRPAARFAAAAPAAVAARQAGPATAPDKTVVALALAGLIQFGDARAGAAAPVLVSPVTGQLQAPIGLPTTAAAGAAAAHTRWSGDAWLLLRGGANRAAGFGVGQLGGSQAGVRVAYALGKARRVAVFGRLDTPLHGPGREAALGVEWRPTSAPVRLVAETRLPLDGGAVAPAVGAVGGLPPTPVGAGFRLEAYGQAGAIDRDGVSGFADGAARATHRLATIGPVLADLGAGAWGAAQRGAARLDIGPTIGAAFRVGRLPARLTVDWRQRVAGDARPGSGVAVSLGADF